MNGYRQRAIQLEQNIENMQRNRLMARVQDILDQAQVSVYCMLLGNVTAHIMRYFYEENIAILLNKLSTERELLKYNLKLKNVMNVY